jgi:hypothetical protein
MRRGRGRPPAGVGACRGRQGAPRASLSVGGDGRPGGGGGPDLGGGSRRAGPTGSSSTVLVLRVQCGRREDVDVARQVKACAACRCAYYCGRPRQKERWTSGGRRAACGLAGADRPDGAARAVLPPGDEASEPHAARPVRADSGHSTRPARARVTRVRGWRSRTDMLPRTAEEARVEQQLIRVGSMRAAVPGPGTDGAGTDPGHPHWSHGPARAECSLSRAARRRGALGASWRPPALPLYSRGVSRACPCCDRETV